GRAGEPGGAIGGGREEMSGGRRVDPAERRVEIGIVLIFLHVATLGLSLDSVILRGVGPQAWRFTGRTDESRELAAPRRAALARQAGHLPRHRTRLRLPRLRGAGRLQCAPPPRRPRTPE